MTISPDLIAALGAAGDIVSVRGRLYVALDVLEDMRAQTTIHPQPKAAAAAGGSGDERGQRDDAPNRGGE